MRPAPYTTRSDPSRRFSAGELKARHPDVHAQYCTIEELGCSFSFTNKPRINAYPEVQEALKAAKDAVVEVDVDEVQLDKHLPRDEETTNLHGDYLRLKGQLAEIEGDLVRYELDLRHICGENEGVEGICSYKRIPKKKFDDKAFQSEHPEFWEECHVDRPAQRRIKVLASRDYA